MVDHGCSPFYIFLITAFLSPSQNTAPETGLFHDLLCCHGLILRNCHPLVFHIIEAVDNGDHFS